mgnify:CR=1 FL=1
MATVVGVRFKKSCKIYYFDPEKSGVEKGDSVIVETVRGLEYADVVLGPKEIEDEKLQLPLKPIIRKTTAADDAQLEENNVKEKEAFNICLEKIKNHELPMHLIDAEFTFDLNKLTFYFTADGRVDFRELVKDLASVFHTRIELRQIGVRDEAKMLNGIGYCGRPLCCATFLGDFAPVSIHMAKNQGLSLNPAKISGICGRLLCCLEYEDDNYSENHGFTERSFAPRMGVMVATPQGKGKVVFVNKKEHTAEIQLSPSNIVTVEWDEIMDENEAVDD